LVWYSGKGAWASRFRLVLDKYLLPPLLLRVALRRVRAVLCPR
jgi:hypothetical protein